MDRTKARHQFSAKHKNSQDRRLRGSRQSNPDECFPQLRLFRFQAKRRLRQVILLELRIITVSQIRIR